MITQIELPWPPSANQMYRHVGYKVLISERGRKYRAQVAEAHARAGSPRLEGLLSLKMLAFPPDNRRRDIDNLCKGLVDALMLCGLFQDDSQIVRLVVEKKGVTEGGKVIVEVEEVDSCS